MGAPTKLTAELTASIVSDIENGNYSETAAQAAGITVATFCNWMKWGGQGREPYAAFFEAVTCARAKAEIDLVEVVKVGDGKGEGFGAARAAAFILERTRPKRFAQRINVKVQDELERLLDVAQRVLAPDAFQTLCEALASDEHQEAPEMAAEETTH